MVDMKRLICITLAILAIGMQLYAVNEDVVTWEQILKDVNTDEQRIAIILKIMEFKDKDFTPILVSTLEKIANKKTDTVSATATYNQNILIVCGRCRNRVAFFVCDILKGTHQNRSEILVFELHNFENNRDALLVGIYVLKNLLPGHDIFVYRI